MNYKKPILTEILIKLVFEKGSLRESEIFDIVPKAKASGLTLVEIGQGMEIGQPIKNDEPKEGLKEGFIVPKIRCWNPEKTLLLQLMPDTIIANQVGEYLGWDELKKFFHTNLDFAKDAIQNTNYKSVLLQTIDNFSVNREGFSLGQYLNCGGNKVPAWYQNSNESADITLGRGFLEEDMKNRQIRIGIRKQKESFSVRIDSIFHNKLNTKRDLNEVLEELHIESNESFESVITDKVRNEIMGGVI